MKTAWFYLALVLVTVACGNDPQKQSDEVSIQLNNGAKWEVNDEMKPHIEQGQVLLNDYISNERSDHQRLAEELKSQNNKLIKSCTMKGESHDELHKWLHPHMKLIKNLDKAKSTEEVESAIEDIERSFDLYNSYFH